jgi:microcystin-dependent protein
MTVENAQYISQLNKNWPTDDDYGYEGDNHIRVTKQATIQSLPNIDGPVNCTPAELNQFAGAGAALFAGEVRMYAGAVAPAGWLLCDGAAIPPEHTALIALVGANTPDMRGQFVRGWSDDVAQDRDGPRAPLTTQVEMVGPHQHLFGQNSSNWNGGPNVGNIVGNNTAGNYATSDNSGTENTPKNIAVLFIIKT